MKSIKFLLFFMITQHGFAQTFQKECGGPLNGNIGYGVQQTNDGNYIFTGTEGSFGSSGDIYLIKTDANGDTLWAEYAGFGGIDGGKEVIQTNDNGFIVAGISSPNGFNDACLLKTDENGLVQWNKSYGGNFDDWANAMVQTNDSGYVLVGVTASYGAGMKDVLFLKTNNQGDVIWSKSFGGSNDDSGQKVELTNDNGFLICASSKSFGAGDNDFYLIKTDSSGNLSWSKRFGGPSDDYCSGAVEDSIGNFLVYGYTNSFGAGMFDAYVVCINPVGNLIWSKTYGTTGSEYFYDMEQTTDGGFILCGQSYTPNFSATNAYLIKLSSVGDTLWTSVLSGSMATAIKQTSDGGCIATGTSSFGSGSGGVYFLKTNSTGQTSCASHVRTTITGLAPTQVNTTSTFTTGIIIPVSNQMPNVIGYDGDLANACFSLSDQITEEDENIISIYPNPSVGKFSILTKNKLDFIEIINSYGELVYRINNPASISNDVELSDTNSGIYFIRVGSNDHVSSRKILILKN